MPEAFYHRACRNRSFLAVAICLLWTALVDRVPAQAYRNRTVDEWSSALGSDDVRQRWYATVALARIGPSARQAIPQLMELLADRSQYEYVRAGAAMALGSIQEDADRVVPLLTQTLQSDLASVRRNSARALGQFGERAAAAAPAMLAQLQRDDVVFRVDLAEALWRVARHERAIPFLTDQVRLGQAGSFEAAEALGRLLPQNREQAIPALIEALESENRDVARSAARSLGRAGAMAMADLAEAARAEDSAVRRGAVEAYGWKGPDGVSGLIAALDDTSHEVRRAATRGLGRLGPEVSAVEPALLRAVNDSDPQVRKTAAAALKRISDGR